MIVNSRKIIFITYSTERNWKAELPKSNWLCLLVDNNRLQHYLSEVISELINHDVAWIATIGDSCETTHDLADDEIAIRQLDIGVYYLPEHEIMTTYHTDFEEGTWFSVFAAHDETVQIDTVVILDMTEGKERGRINAYLEPYCYK